MRSLVVGLLLLVGAGCGGSSPKLVAVTGKVLHKDTPVTAATIWFALDEGNSHPGKEPSCLLQLDGSFVMRTFPWGDGVPPGKWKVYLSPEAASRMGKPEYGNPAKTPWRLEVPESGVSNKVFDVK